MDLGYLKETAQVLIDCRLMLRYSYVYAYFLPDEEIGKPLFEYNQSQLEYYTELLSEMVQDTGKFSRQSVINQTATTEMMRKKLSEGKYVARQRSD